MSRKISRLLSAISFVIALLQTNSCLAKSVPVRNTCTAGIRIEGTVVDASDAAIPGARISIDGTQRATTDPAGQYFLPCIPTTAKTITVQASGFAALSQSISSPINGIAHLNLKLAIATVTASIQVRADTQTLDTTTGASTKTLSTAEIQQLPDDPDDLLQQLQLLAAAGGGSTTSAVVVVDGFQNGSAMPPKSAIASIRINPDPISPEYGRPNMDGGRIEITTKPGADRYHGALFFTDSDSSFNATDPFSVTATPAGKRRYGFELGGPVKVQKSGFALALEKRDINEFNVVNAVTLDASGNQAAEHDTISAPQELWIASARGDLQVTRNDIASLSYAARVNSLGNQGVGGLVLPEAGYSSRIAEYDLRFTNTQTVNANLLHETHVGYTWKRTEQSPNSTEPSLQVSGYFTGGGATSQDLNNRERDLEIDEDLLATIGKHTMKFGAQSLGIFVHNYAPDTFNGAFTFGGGSAPVLDANNQATDATTTITPIEQYRRALLGLAGGTPTNYAVTSGDPLVSYAQWQLALYGEDTVKLLPRLSITAGLRYDLQTTPGTFVNFGPRFGMVWAVDRATRWTLHLRSGIFNTPFDTTYAAEAYRLDGVLQKQTTVYSPDFSNPLVPTSDSIAVENRWQFSRSMLQVPVAEFSAGLEGDLPHHWHPTVWYSWYVSWGDYRTANINAPMVASSNDTTVDPTEALLAPRPGSANLNIFEYQNAAHTHSGVFWAGIEQKANPHWTLSLGYWNVNARGDSTTPQSSYSVEGDTSRPDWESSGALLEDDFKFPYHVELSTQAYWHFGIPYNITTGTDNNGDGNFNDRPSYASAPGDGVYSTPFGLMTTNTVNGDVPRNLGTMPTVVHMYGNLSREFHLSPSKDHPLVLTLNARGVNLLNHTNVTAVNTVVSSSAVGQAVAAEAARRVELGARFSF